MLLWSLLFFATVFAGESINLSINWATSTGGLVPGPGGWNIFDDGRRIRFDVQNSNECPPNTNPNVQTGTATATIILPEPYFFQFTISGEGETVSGGFEVLLVTLDGTQVLRGTSPGGGGGECVMGPSITTTLNGFTQPVLLAAGSHTFQLDFTTGDQAFHFNAFYELDLFISLP